MNPLKTMLLVPLALTVLAGAVVALGVWCVLSGLWWLLFQKRNVKPRNDIFWDDTKAVCFMLLCWLCPLLALVITSF